MKSTELKMLLKVAVKMNAPVLIVGQPGIGKSDIVSQVALETKYRLIISHPVVADPTDYKGMPWVTVTVDGTPKAFFIPFKELEELVNATEPTIYFLDDLGQAPASVQAACMQLLLARRINGHKVSDKVTFVAASNRRQDMAGVTGILEPVKSRFSSIIQLNVDLEDWTKWALENDMPVELINFIRFRPNLLMDFKPSKDMVNSPCPRTVAAVGRWMKAGVPKEIEFETYAGAAGEGFASEFVAFLKIYRGLPDLDLVIKSPTVVEIPGDLATLYALCAGLAAKVDEQNFDQIVKFANRLVDPIDVNGKTVCYREYSVMLLKDCLARNPKLQKSKSFIEWASKNAKLFI